MSLLTNSRKLERLLALLITEWGSGEGGRGEDSDDDKNSVGKSVNRAFSTLRSGRARMGQSEENK